MKASESTNRIKYLFLDIDGVLWTVGWSIFCNRNGGRSERRCYTEWDPMVTSNLQWVLDQAKEQGVEVRIVISSTWRLGRTLEELKVIAEKSGLDPNSIIGKTPSIYYKVPKTKWYWKSWGPWYGRIFPFRSKRTEADRGVEIQYWMDQNNIKAEDIAIIDDDSDMAHLKHRHVKTDAYDGLGFRKAIEVAKRLGVRD